MTLKIKKEMVRPPTVYETESEYKASEKSCISKNFQQR